MYHFLVQRSQSLPNISFSHSKGKIIIAGYKFAVAVPDVVIITTGFCEVLAIPNAKNPFDLSSIMLWQVNCLFSIKATVNGEFLDPGEIQTCFTPNRANTSAEFFDQVKLETDN